MIFCEARAAEGDHALLEALPLDLDRGRAGEDELADLFGDLEDLDERDAALVAGVVALLAALALHDLHGLRVLRREAEGDEDLRRDFRRRLAVRADAPDEALRRDEDDGRRDEVRLDAHVHEAVDRGGRVVRVERREHEVARERGLDRDLGRLEVADLADEDDVRVLPQERAQRGREVQADLSPSSGPG